jgi:hypothetical protein
LKSIKTPALKIAGAVAMGVMKIVGGPLYKTIRGKKFGDEFVKVMKKNKFVDSNGSTPLQKYSFGSGSRSSLNTSAIIKVAMGIGDFASSLTKTKYSTEWNGSRYDSPELTSPFNLVPELVQWNTKPLLEITNSGRIKSKYEGMFGIDESFPAKPHGYGNLATQDGSKCERRNGEPVPKPASEYEPTKNVGNNNPGYENYRRIDSGAIDWEAVKNCFKLTLAEGGKSPQATLNAFRKRIKGDYEADLNEWTKALQDFIEYNKMVDVVYKAEITIDRFQKQFFDEIQSQTRRRIEDIKPAQKQCEAEILSYIPFVKKLINDFFKNYENTYSVPYSGGWNTQLVLQVYNILVYLCYITIKKYEILYDIPLKMVYNSVANTLYETVVLKLAQRSSSQPNTIYINPEEGFNFLNSDDLFMKRNILYVLNGLFQKNPEYADLFLSKIDFIEYEGITVSSNVKPISGVPLWYKTYEEFEVNLDGVLYPFKSNNTSANVSSLSSYAGSQLLNDFIPKEFFETMNKKPPTEPLPPVIEVPSVQPTPVPVNVPDSGDSTFLDKSKGEKARLVAEEKKRKEKEEAERLQKELAKANTEEDKKEIKKELDKINKPQTKKELDEYEMNLGLNLLKQFSSQKKVIPRRRIRLYNPNI